MNTVLALCIKYLMIDRENAKNNQQTIYHMEKTLRWQIYCKNILAEEYLANSDPSLNQKLCSETRVQFSKREMWLMHQNMHFVP